MITIKENGMVDARELHNFVEVKTEFNSWIKRGISDLEFIEGKDFSSFLAKSTGGRPSKEYDLTTDSAKEICIFSATPKAKELRRWLIQLSNQVENNDLLTHEQVIYLSKLKAVFSFISECQKAEELNKNVFIQESNSKNPFAEFHKMRNEILKLDPFTIDERLKQYCIENQRLLPKGKTKIEKLIVLDKYEVLRNGVWDFLTATKSEQALKLANLVKKMAEAENLAIKRVNEVDLLNQKKVELPKLN